MQAATVSHLPFIAAAALALAASGLAASPGDGPNAVPSPAEDRARKVETRASGGRTTVVLRGFESVEVAQEEPVWCWAACAEMILRYGGVEASQEEIAARIHGYEGDAVKVAAASRYEVYRALCPDAATAPFEALADAIVADLAAAAVEAEGESGARGKLSVQWRAEQAAQIALDRLAPPKGVPIEHLERGHPAVVGMREAQGDAMGHLYVLVGATYRERSALERRFKALGESLLKDLAPEARATIERFAPSDFEVFSVVLVDPLAHDDPATEADEMRLAMPFETFCERVDFVTTRKDAREILGRWSGLARVRVKGR
jgi:hypothetical protein